MAFLLISSVDQSQICSEATRTTTTLPPSDWPSTTLQPTWVTSIRGKGGLRVPSGFSAANGDFSFGSVNFGSFTGY